MVRNLLSSLNGFSVRSTVVSTRVCTMYRTKTSVNKRRFSGTAMVTAVPQQLSYYSSHHCVRTWDTPEPNELHYFSLAGGRGITFITPCTTVPVHVYMYQLRTNLFDTGGTHAASSKNERTRSDTRFQFVLTNVHIDL